MEFSKSIRWLFVPAWAMLFSLVTPLQDSPIKFTPRWDHVTNESKTTPTLQVVVNPPLRRGTPVHDNVYKALSDLGAEYVRYVPWLPYPRLGVAKLEPQRDGRTSWDFSLIDPIVEIAPISQFAQTHPYVYASAVVTEEGKRKMLLVNKQNGNFDLSIAGASGGQLEYVDITTGFQPPTSTKLTSDNLTLHSFSVAVLILP